MSLGNVLIRPQVLNRRAINDDAQLMDLLIGLATRLLEDFLRGGAASRKIVHAVEKTQEDFVKPFIPRLETVGTKLKTFLKPYLDTLDGFKDPSTDMEGLKKIIDAAFALTDKVIEDIDSQHITAKLNVLLDIVENDLGVSRAGFEKFFLDCLDNIETALMNDFLNGTQNEESLNNFLLGIQIRSARRQVRALLAIVPLPELNLRASIRTLSLALVEAGWDEKLGKLKTSLADAKSKLPDLMKTLSDAFGSQQAQTLMGRDMDEPAEYAWYASWAKEKTVILPNRFAFSEAELAKNVRINDISLGFLEHWTHWGYIAVQVLKAIGDGRNIGQGNLWSPLLNVFNRGSDAIFSFISIFMHNQTWADFMKIKKDKYFDFAFTEGLTLAGSFENIPDFWTWFWSIWQQDRADAADAKAFELPDFLSFLEPEKLYELSLSIFTLRNTDDTEGCENQEHHAAIREFCKDIMGEFVAKRLVKSNNRYHGLFDDVGDTIVTYLAGASMMWAADIVGWLLAGAISKGRLATASYWGDKEFGDKFFGGDNAYGAFLYAFKDFHGIFDLEGDTEGGKYGLKKRLVNGTFELIDVEFKGYAARESSPYFLPFETNKLVFCSQTHRGRSSHNNFTGLIYGVDFLIKRDELVLAMRGGTVVDYADFNRMGDNGLLNRLERIGRVVTFQEPIPEESLNYIIIRHDDVNNEHDKDDLGNPTTTYACYENSEPFSIRRAFAVRGISEEGILGSRIEQGTPLMFLGKRVGIASFDHLQVYVSAATANGLLPTIPFVFKDILDEGIPEKGKYYRSGNVSIAALNMPLFHPEKCEGVVQESGLDYVILEQNANENDDFYKDAHIFLSFDLPDGGVGYAYKKIKNYHGDDRKVVIEGAWVEGDALPQGAHYRVGSKPFTASPDFDKKFAYIVGRNVAGEVEPLGGVVIPPTLAKKGAYHAPVVSGRITGGGLLRQREVTVDDNASASAADYRQQHIAIFRAGQLIQYQLIEDYRIEAGLKKITIAGRWELDLITTGTADDYQIGSAPYERPDAVKDSAYLAPDAVPNLYMPTDLSDKEPPYVFG